MNYFSGDHDDAKPISFGIVGAGWRTEFYLRIARALPERFAITGIVVRNESKGSLLEQDWGIPTFRNIETMLARTKPSFVVTSVPARFAGQATNQTYSEYMQIQRCCELLRATDLKVYGVAQYTGFKDMKHFYLVAK